MEILSKEKILSTIREHRSELNKFGVKRLGIFGSFAHGTPHTTSDLDFVVEFERKTFDAYMGLKQYLEELFERRVDLVLPNTIKSRLRSKILSEIVDAA